MSHRLTDSLVHINTVTNIVSKKLPESAHLKLANVRKAKIVLKVFLS